MVKKEFKTGIRQETGGTSKDAATRVRGLRSLIAVVICLAVTAMFFGCGKDEPKESKENLQYLKTELGGCNRQLPDDSETRSSETKGDTVVITVSDDSVRVFVGLNYICCAPFETNCETIDDTIIMYIVDTCSNPYEECYCRCMCYYTFDFIFTHQGQFNQKYKVLLIDPRKEEHVIISEGIITENK